MFILDLGARFKNATAGRCGWLLFKLETKVRKLIYNK